MADRVIAMGRHRVTVVRRRTSSTPIGGDSREVTLTCRLTADGSTASSLLARSH
jgi:hypothetical protein